MKRQVTESNSTGEDVRHQAHAATFAKVVDARKQPIRRLWVRNGRYYAQLKIENAITGVKKTRRVPLGDKEGKLARNAAEGWNLIRPRRWPSTQLAVRAD